MKKIIALLCAGLILAAETKLTATSLIYTSNQTNYQAKNYVFRKNDTAQGFVRLNNGFTVLPDACANLDLLFSVSSFIDLRETGTMLLLHDLIFDKWVSFSSGGNINGQGNVIKLNGNLTIPSNKVLHINGNTIIDGQGCALIIGANAEIFVDTNVTLTLRNMSLANYQHAPTFPPIRCGATTSKLALDNVILEPCGDFLFPQGQLFIHHDVMITGTSAFVYSSPVPSFITKNSCLYLDYAITFSMAPATFTDAPYSLKNTYTDNNFIRMADETAVLYLDGCTLQTTNTGWRLTTGTVNFDNRVQIKTDPTLTMTALEPCVRKQYFEVDSIAWHPSGNYIAVNSLDWHNPTIEIYRFDGSSLTSVASYDDGTSWYAMQWNPDGRYLVVGGKAGFSLYGLKIFSFDGTSLTLVTDIGGDIGGSTYWSPDGRYLALSTNGGNTLRVYRFDGSSLEQVAQLVVSTVEDLIWSKDGRHIIAGGDSGLCVYDFDGTALTLLASANNGPIYGLSLSADGRYIGVAIFSSFSSGQVAVYRFDGNSLVLDDLISAGPGYTCDWSPDGRYFALGVSYNNGLGPIYTQVYSFDGKALSLIPGSVMEAHDFINVAIIYTVRFSPNGKYLAMGGALWNGGDPLGPRNDSLKIYAVDYVQTTSPQTLATSMVFGDSAKGDAYDVHLRLQPGASVNLNGKMLYDNVN